MTSYFPIGRLKLLMIKTSLLPAAPRLVKVGKEMILSKEIKGIIHQGSEEENSSVVHGDYYDSYQDYSGEPCDPAIYDDCDESYDDPQPKPELTGHCKGESPLLEVTTYLLSYLLIWYEGYAMESDIKHGTQRIFRDVGTLCHI